MRNPLGGSVISQCALILDNYRYWKGEELLIRESPEKDAQKLYEAPFVVLSHGNEADPLFNYANLKAQELWEMNWEAFIGMPSRRSAEPPAEKDRKKFLEEAARKGYIDGYEGVRISRTGKRFYIKNVLLLNLLGPDKLFLGQAAIFDEWKPL